MASGYDRRNARARAEGYRNDYDRRLHDNGAIPASEPVTPEMRARNRGHRGYADLLRLIERSPRARTPGNRVRFVLPAGLERGPDGRYTRIHVAVFMEDGSQRDFFIRAHHIEDPARNPASQENLARLRATLGASGVTYIAAPSIDVFSQPPRAGDDEDDFDLEDFDLEDELEDVG